MMTFLLPAVLSALFLLLGISLAAPHPMDRDGQFNPFDPRHLGLGKINIGKQGASSSSEQNDPHHAHTSRPVLSSDIPRRRVPESARVSGSRARSRNIYSPGNEGGSSFIQNFAGGSTSTQDDISLFNQSQYYGGQVLPQIDYGAFGEPFPPYNAAYAPSHTPIDGSQFGVPYESHLVKPVSSFENPSYNYGYSDDYPSPAFQNQDPGVVERDYSSYTGQGSSNTMPPPIWQEGFPTGYTFPAPDTGTSSPALPFPSFDSLLHQQGFAQGSDTSHYVEREMQPQSPAASEMATLFQDDEDGKMKAIEAARKGNLSPFWNSVDGCVKEVIFTIISKETGSPGYDILRVMHDNYSPNLVMALLGSDRVQFRAAITHLYPTFYKKNRLLWKHGLSTEMQESLVYRLHLASHQSEIAIRYFLRRDKITAEEAVYLFSIADNDELVAWTEQRGIFNATGKFQRDLITDKNDNVPIDSNAPDYMPWKDGLNLKQVSAVIGIVMNTCVVDAKQAEGLLSIPSITRDEELGFKIVKLSQSNSNERIRKLMVRMTGAKYQKP
jgi:hypothetical protein